MKIALGQINPTVGDIPGNLALLTRFATDAAARGADLIVFPELAITGYPPLDLVEKPSFLSRAEAAVDELAVATAHLPLAIVAGYTGKSHETLGKRAVNSAAVLRPAEKLGADAIRLRCPARGRSL